MAGYIPSPTRSTFVTLPAEVCQIIYKHVFAGTRLESQSLSLDDKLWKLDRARLGILYTCHQTRAQALPVFYAAVIWRFDSFLPLIRYFSPEYNRTCWARMRHIELDDGWDIRHLPQYLHDGILCNLGTVQFPLLIDLQAWPICGSYHEVTQYSSDALAEWVENRVLWNFSFMPIDKHAVDAGYQSTYEMLRKRVGMKVLVEVQIKASSEGGEKWLVSVPESRRLPCATVC